MSQELHSDRSDRFDAGLVLASGYDELTLVDQALRDAERRLRVAHALCSQHGAGEAHQVYLEVIALRDKSRSMLAVLGEIWVADR